MSAFRLGFDPLGRFVVVVMLMSGLTFVSSSIDHTIASASTAIPTCFNNQLEMAVAWGPGAAAGNVGIPFLIINISKSACAVRGYPKLTFIPSSYKKKSIKVIDGGGMIYVQVKPRIVVIRPGASAAFGLNFINAANQQDPNGPACTVQNVYVALPVRTVTLPHYYVGPVNFNFCHSNFRVSVTSIQSGPRPKDG
jgi:hypothetical protein